MSSPKINPAIILVEPQMGENIGAAARAMLNFGLSDLRLVNPRDGWPNEKAVAMAASADSVLENARAFPSVEEAISDLQHVYATTARPRDMIKHVATPKAAALEMHEYASQETAIGILFGKESSGLASMM
ncbi:RNA methyltransferase [Sneathiella glossodoripedis]|uniref:RNA methyltransferase n=1 Tax=Sneathiella glossodoripedis TaxID=418853 RepID=UPI000AB081EE|nr:RNA methyltransferase [Sneathiella glossodoripedis]